MSFPTRVKICGITRVQDAEFAVDAGADAIGLVFHPPSPRAVDVETAAGIVLAVGPFVSVVGLFVDAPVAWIMRVLGNVSLDLLQFHGGESAAACARYGRRYLKAVRMAPGVNVRSVAERHTAAAGLLVDAYHPEQPGGTGEVFDWQRIPADLPRPLILAGGLTVANVAEAVRQVRPAAVDVSSGVEASPGVKDHVAIREFIQEARGVDDGCGG